MIWVAFLATLVAAPPVRVTLSKQVLTSGDRVKVRVRLAEDSYLVVLRADTRGHIRVLFPSDPADSGFARGGRELAILDRGGREGFVVDEREGSGIVLVARAATPFNFQEFTRGVHWDYRALAATDSGATGEDALRDVLERMATADYDYDVVAYTVTTGAHSGYDGAHHGAYRGRSIWVTAGVVISF